MYVCIPMETCGQSQMWFLWCHLLYFEAVLGLTPAWNSCHRLLSEPQRFSVFAFPALALQALVITPRSIFFVCLFVLLCFFSMAFGRIELSSYVCKASTLCLIHFLSLYWTASRGHREWLIYTVQDCVFLLMVFAHKVTWQHISQSAFLWLNYVCLNSYKREGGKLGRKKNGVERVAVD